PPVSTLSLHDALPIFGRATHARHRRSDGPGSGAKTGPCPRHGWRPASGLVRPGSWPCHVLVGLASDQHASLSYQRTRTVGPAWRSEEHTSELQSRFDL